MHMRNCGLIGLLVAACVTASTSWANPDCIDYRGKAHWTGATNLAVEPRSTDEEDARIIANGDVIYVVGANYTWTHRLYAIDVADATAPVVVDSLSVSTFDAVLHEGRLYAASGGLNVLGLEDARHPVPVAHLECGFGLFYVRAAGRYAFVGGCSDGLSAVVDIADPTQPVLLGSFPWPWTIETLSLAGDVGYIGSGSDIAVLDLADPLHPSILRYVHAPEPIREMTVEGHLGAAFGTSSLYLFDLSDAANPVMVSSIMPRRSWYRNRQQVEIEGDLLLWKEDFGAEIWDISDPGHPAYLGLVQAANGAKAFGLGVDRIYELDADTSLRMTFAIMDFNSRDLSARNAPTLLFEDTMGYSFDFADGRLITCANRVLAVYDLPAPDSPVRRGTLTDGFIQDIVDADGNLVVVEDWFEYRLVDLSNPDDPVFRGSLPTASLIRLRGQLAYFAGMDANHAPVLAVYDVSDPDHPMPIGTPPPAAGASADLIFGDGIAVAQWSGLVAIFDISDPAAVRLLWSFDADHLNFSGIGLDGTHLYIGRENGRVEVFDLSDPTSPLLIAGKLTLGLPMHFAFAGDYMYVNEYFSGCEIFDISDVSAPRCVASLLNPITYRMRIHGGRIYFDNKVAPLQCDGVSAVGEPALAPFPTSARISPNPFNPATSVAFDLAVVQSVRLAVYDVAGRLVATLADQVLPAGPHEIWWNGQSGDGRAAPSGVYFFWLEVGGEVQIHKAALLR